MNPLLSVVLCAAGGYPAVRRTVQHLKRQALAPQIELILIGFGGRMEPPPEDVSAFGGWHTVLLDQARGLGAANAEGVRRAHAPIVALSEDHCFPEPGWAEALLDAHREPHAAVGPVFCNANPRSIVSWCDFLIGYGPWMEPAQPGLRQFLGGHNCSYKRSELLAYGERLAAMLESETVLHYDLTRRGRTLFLEPRARVAHLNFAKLGVWIKVQLYYGWVFAGFRAAGWTVPRKVLYAAGSPLIPAVRFIRAVRELFAPGRPTSMLWRVAPMLLFGLIADGAGQFLGYLMGPGRSALLVAPYEFNRVRHITEQDRRDLEMSAD